MASGSRKTGKHASSAVVTSREPATGRDSPDGPVARERLELLVRVSKLLTHVESLKRDVVAVLSLIGETVPLRTAILLLEEAGAPALACLWSAEGTSAARQKAAIAHARRVYRHLAGDRLRNIHVQTDTASVLGAREAPAAEADERFVLLPLVVADHPIFGALQVEGLAALDEVDLAFVNAVVNQLALAIDRQRAIDERRALAEARQHDAEQGRAQAEALQRRYEALVDNLHHAFVWEATAPAR